MTLDVPTNSLIRFKIGSKDRLEQWIRLILYSFPALWASEESEIVVTVLAASLHTDCRPDIGSIGKLFTLPLSRGDHDRLMQLLYIALEGNPPIGESFEQDDEMEITWYPQEFDVAVPRPSFHELAESRAQLRSCLQAGLLPSDLEHLLHRD